MADEDTYVILITGRQSVGHLTSHEVWRLTKFEIIPLRLDKENAIQVCHGDHTDVLTTGRR